MAANVAILCLLVLAASAAAASVPGGLLLKDFLVNSPLTQFAVSALPGQHVELEPTQWGTGPVFLSRPVELLGPGTLVLRGDWPFISSNSPLSLTNLTIVVYPRGATANTALTAAAAARSQLPLAAFSSLSGVQMHSVLFLAAYSTLQATSAFWDHSEVLASWTDAASGSATVPRAGPAVAQALTAASVAVYGAQLSDAVLLMPQGPGPDPGCYAGGVATYNSANLRAALVDTNVTSIYVHKSLVLSPNDFSYYNPVVLAGRAVSVYGCGGDNAPELDLNGNWTRQGIQVAQGGNVTLKGLSLANDPLMNRLFWPMDVPLVSLVEVEVGGTCHVVSSSMTTYSRVNLTLSLELFLRNPVPELRPNFTVTSSGALNISSWRLDGRVWEPSPGISPAAAAATSWQLKDVVVKHVELPCLSSDGMIGIRLESGKQLRELMNDPLIPALQIVNNITFRKEEWPPEASSPLDGQVFVNATKEVYACHPVPGNRYTVDFGDLGQVVFVFGTLRWTGDMLMINPRASPRRAWLYLLIGALSVETDGVIFFKDVIIRSTVPSPFHSAADPFWTTNCGALCPGFIPNANDMYNASYYDIFIYDYIFKKTQWVAVTQNRNITGTGFWGYQDVTLDWRPPPLPPPPPPPAPPPGWVPDAATGGNDGDNVPIAAIVVPAVVGTVLLLAVAAGVLYFLRKKHRKMEALDNQIPLSNEAAQPGSNQASMKDTVNHNSSSENIMAGMGIVSQQGKDGKERSTMANQSVMSGSMPTEARIEDMKRTINAAASTARNEQITLAELLGEGTFGKVYKGYWRGTLVAVKTMVFPANMSGKEKREKMAVMETAISSSLSHPNIVQTYTYSIIPVKGGGNNMVGGADAGQSMTVDNTSQAAFLSAGPEEPNIHSWEVRLVLEFCDMGSLRDVLNKGPLTASGKPWQPPAPSGGALSALALPAPSQDAGALADGAAGAVIAAPAESAALASAASHATGSVPPAAATTGPHVEMVTVDYATVLDTALDVARAMLHLHQENIIHSDLKARNILLKSCGGGPAQRAFIAKVADFGLSLRIDPSETHVSNVYQGTITHMAPEVLIHGKVGRASDVYAFGVLLWELFTSGQPFKGTPRALLGHEITKMGRRPEFPYNTPFEYQLLACRCWESDPAIRPDFKQILDDLMRMRTKLTFGGASTPPAMSSGNNALSARAGTGGLEGGANVQSLCSSSGAGVGGEAGTQAGPELTGDFTIDIPAAVVFCGSSVLPEGVILGGGSTFSMAPSSDSVVMYPAPAATRRAPQLQPIDEGADHAAEHQAAVAAAAAEAAAAAAATPAGS